MTLTCEFDRNDPKNIGRPLYWRLEDHIKAIEGMIRADELQIALKMCDELLPAWYRENPPKELEDIKKKLYQNLYSQFTYASDDEEAGISREKAESEISSGYMYPRADILMAFLRTLEEPPFIVDFGCSHGHLPMSLQKLGFKFNYLGLGMNWRAVQKIKEWLEPGVWAGTPKPNQKTIFVCFETIEHMADENDLARGAMKLGIEFDHIFMSVPYGCLFGGLYEWERPLGHLRGYTKQDFINLATKTFTGYEWKLSISHSLILEGVKK